VQDNTEEEIEREIPEERKVNVEIWANKKIGRVYGMKRGGRPDIVVEISETGRGNPETTKRYIIEVGIAWDSKIVEKINKKRMKYEDLRREHWKKKDIQ
jgi:hypothetical protein